MEYRRLGRSGPTVSVICFGGAHIGWEGWEGYSPIRSTSAICKAIDLGINFIDTAETYPGSEEVIGKAINGRRNDVVICTKVWGDHLHHDDVIKTVNQSLSRLGTKYVDLLLIHWPNPTIPFKETADAMEELLKEGKVNHIGLSNFNTALMIKCQESFVSEFVVNQIEYNMLVRNQVEADPIPYCKEAGIAIMAYSPLGGGILSGKYNSTSQVPKDVRLTRRGTRYYENPQKLIPLFNVLHKVSAETGKTFVQIALNWLIRDPDAVVVPVTMMKVEQVEEVVGSTGWRLSKNQIQQVETVLDEVGSMAPESMNQHLSKWK